MFAVLDALLRTAFKFETESPLRVREERGQPFVSTGLSCLRPVPANDALQLAPNEA